MGNIDGIIGNGGIFEIGGVGGNDGLKPTLQFTLQPTLRRTQTNIETYMPSFPRKWESRISGFQSFPIDSRRVGGLDSRLRGNDGFQDYGVVGRISRLRCCRTDFEITVLSGMTGFKITVLSGMTVRVFHYACPAPVNGKCIKNAV